MSALGCDALFIWGKIHVSGEERNIPELVPTGYPFKRFVLDSSTRKDEILKKIGADPEKKVVSFFDESFGGDCRMTEVHYVRFWQAALICAQKDRSVTVLIKQKASIEHQRLSPEIRAAFDPILDIIKKTPNIVLVDNKIWSFIEVIGASDVVVTQGMTSTSGIAIVCGKQGLYLDETNYDHPFKRMYKDKIVFSDCETLVNMIYNIIYKRFDVFDILPDELKSQYDNFNDDRGVNLIRDYIAGRRELKGAN